MVNIPRFEREVSVEQTTGNADVSGYRAEAQFASGIQRLVDSSVAQQTKTALDINFAKSQSTMTSQISKYHDEAMSYSNDPKEQAKYFNEKANSYAESYIDAMPRENRARATVVANGAIGIANKQFMQSNIQQEKVNAYLNYFDVHHKNIDAMTKAQNSGDMGAAQEVYAQIHNDAEGAARLGFITPKQAEENISDAQKVFNTNNFIKHVEDLAAKSTSDAKSFLSEAGSKGIGGFTNAESQSLINKGNAIVSRHEQSLVINSQALKDSASSLVSQALQIGRIDKNKLSNLQNSLSEDQYAGLEKKINDSLELNSQSSDLMSLNPAQREIELNKLRDSDFEKYTNVSKLVNKQEQEFNDNPVAFLQEHPAVVHAQQEKILADNGVNTVDVSQNPNSFLDQTPLDAMVHAQKIMGIQPSNVKVMTNASALSYVSDLKSKPLGERINELNSISQRYGKYAPEAWKQLAKSGLPMETQLLVNLPNRSQQYIPIAIDSFDAGQKELAKQIDPDDVKTLREDITSNISPIMSTFTHYNAMPAGTMNSIQESIVTLGMGLLARGEAKDPKEAARIASDTLINNSYDTERYNGNSFRIPKALNISSQALYAASSMHKTLEHNGYSVPSNYLPELKDDPEYRSKMYYSDRLADAYFVTSSDNKTLQMVDSEGVKVSNKNGVPYKFNFSDLSNPDSDIYKITSHMRKHDQEEALAPHTVTGSVATVLSKLFKGKKLKNLPLDNPLESFLYYG